MSRPGPVRRGLEFLSVIFGYWLFTLTWATLDGLHRQLYSRAGAVETIVSWLSFVFFILIIIKIVQLIIAILSTSPSEGKGLFGWIGERHLEFGKWNTERHKIGMGKDAAKIDRKNALDEKLGKRAFEFRSISGKPVSGWGRANPLNWKIFPWRYRQGPKPAPPPIPSFASELASIKQQLDIGNGIIHDIYAFLGSIGAGNPASRKLLMKEFDLGPADPRIKSEMFKAGSHFYEGQKYINTGAQLLMALSPDITKASSEEQTKYHQLDGEMTSLLAQIDDLNDFFNNTFSTSTGTNPGAPTP